MEEEIEFTKLVKDGLPDSHCLVIDIKQKFGTIIRIKCSEYECLYGNKFSSLLLEMTELISDENPRYFLSETSSECYLLPILRYMHSHRNDIIQISECDPVQLARSAMFLGVESFQCDILELAITSFQSYLTTKEKCLTESPKKASTHNDTAAAAASSRHYQSLSFWHSIALINMLSRDAQQKAATLSVAAIITFLTNNIHLLTDPALYEYRDLIFSVEEMSHVAGAALSLHSKSVERRERDRLTSSIAEAASQHRAADMKHIVGLLRATILTKKVTQTVPAIVNKIRTTRSSVGTVVSIADDGLSLMVTEENDPLKPKMWMVKDCSVL